MTDHDPVNHPTHYKSDAKCRACGESIECIDVTRHMDFDTGNAMKYLWRAGKKDATVQDLRKAIWYIEDKIATLEGRTNPNVHRLSAPDACRCGRTEVHTRENCNEQGPHAFSSPFSSGRVQVSHEEECPLYMGGADPNTTACDCFVIRKAKRQADLIGPAHPSFGQK